MAPPPPPPPAAASLKAAVNAKRYILVALFATLAVAVIVTGFFVLLCPARVTFSVAHTSRRSSGTTAGGSGGGSLELRLTLAADNPSRRAKVTYESMFVDVSNSTAGPGTDHWVSATVTTGMPLRQRGRTAAIDATVHLVDGPWSQAFAGNMTSSFSVVVTAQVRFRVGVASTRLYNIKVSCSPVSFLPAKVKPAGAAGAGGGAAVLPVKCV